MPMHTVRVLAVIARMFASHVPRGNFHTDRSIFVAHTAPTDLLHAQRITLSAFMIPSDTADDIATMEADLAAVEDDEERIALLHEQCRRLLYSHPQQALTFAKKALSLAATRKQRPGQARSYLLIGNVHHHLGNHDRAEHYLEKARRLATRSDDRRTIAESLNVLGMVYNGMGRYRQSIESLNESLALYRDIDPSRVRVILNNLAPVYSQLGDYAAGLECLYQSLPLYEDAGESTGGVELHIGMIHAGMQNWRDARTHTERALDLSRQEGNQRGEGSALKNLATIQAELGELDHAIELARAALDIANKTDHASLKVLSMQSIAACLFMSDRIEESLQWHQQTLALAGELDQRVAVGVQHLNIAIIYQRLGNSDEAIALALQAVAVAEEIGYRELERNAHQLISEIFELRNDAVTAFQHFRKATAINEDLLGREMQSSINRIQMRAEMEKAERDREILQLKTERLELEMQHKTKELTSLAMQLVQKNEMLDDLKRQIGGLAASRNGVSGGGGELAPIIRQIETSRNSEKEWDVFEQQFRALHPEFIDEMARTCPELSPTELKVCALLKINLATKEIATILCSSVRTIEDHRYRIRAKLGLPKGESLGSYLARGGEI